MLRRENGITLIALIITIIILVILAAVSIATVYNMGIVNHAVDGATGYATEAKRENKVMNETTSSLNRDVNHIKYILDSED